MKRTGNNPRKGKARFRLCPDRIDEAILTAAGIKPEQQAALSRCSGCGQIVSRSKSHVCKGPGGKARSREAKDGLRWYDERGRLVSEPPPRPPLRPVEVAKITHPALMAERKEG